MDSDSDELRFTLAPAPHGRDQSHLHPWSLAMGTRVRWAWFLVNSQGYLDGLQIEFGFPGQGPSADITFQLLAVASEIKVAILGRR